MVVFNHHAYTEMGKTPKGRRMALATAVAAIKADPQAREGVDTAPLPVHPMPAQTDLAEVPIQLAAHEVRTWLDEVATEADLIADMVAKHAERLAERYAARVKPTAIRDGEYREAFRPFHDVAELRREIERHSLGKTGRLMTMDELAALSDSQLEPFLHMTHLIFAGETPSVLKLGDVAPLPKDLERARPVTCLDAIYKVVDAAIARRLEEVARRHGLLSANAFGFVKGGSTEWPISLVAAAQWHARETGAVLLHRLHPRRRRGRHRMDPLGITRGIRNRPAGGWCTREEEMGEGNYRGTIADPPANRKAEAGGPQGGLGVSCRRR